MMREAQKMMQDPAFQAHMKKLMSQQGMQQALQKTQTEMADPKKVAELEAKAKKAIADGEKELAKLDRDKDALREKDGKKYDEKKKEGDEQKPLQKSEEDAKPATVTEDQDDMPDIPALNLN